MKELKNIVERRIVKASRTSKITIPLDYLKSLGIEINDIVEVELKKNCIVIRPKSL
jgi:antitoxin component of MazEF toxin-antitoxin module